MLSSVEHREWVSAPDICRTLTDEERSQYEYEYECGSQIGWAIMCSTQVNVIQFDYHLE